MRICVFALFCLVSLKPIMSQHVLYVYHSHEVQSQTLDEITLCSDKRMCVLSGHTDLVSNLKFIDTRYGAIPVV